MWQAYYAKQRARLFGLLVTTRADSIATRGQPRRWRAFTRSCGRHLRRTCAAGYDVVLPDLENA